jgi:hypothetical protein
VVPAAHAGVGDHYNVSKFEEIEAYFTQPVFDVAIAASVAVAAAVVVVVAAAAADAAVVASADVASAVAAQAHQL